MGNSADVISANTHAEGLSTHSWQCMAKFANFIFAPNFYLWTDSFVIGHVARVDPGVTHGQHFANFCKLLEHLFYVICASGITNEWELQDWKICS